MLLSLEELYRRSLEAGVGGIEKASHGGFRCSNILSTRGSQGYRNVLADDPTHNEVKLLFPPDKYGQHLMQLNATEGREHSIRALMLSLNYCFALLMKVAHLTKNLDQHTAERVVFTQTDGFERSTYLQPELVGHLQTMWTSLRNAI